MTAEDRARKAARSLRRLPVGEPPPIEHVRRSRTRRRIAAAVAAALLVTGSLVWSASGDGDDGAAPDLTEVTTDG